MKDSVMKHYLLLCYSRIGGNRQLFKYKDYYEYKNNRKGLGELSLELAIKLESIRTSYQLFKRDYGFYNFSENLTKEELLNDIIE